MIVTAIAHNPERLRERTSLPSVELVYLAKKALQEYGAKRLITSLEPGWEQALAKAAIEQAIPFEVVIPYPARDAEWPREARLLYLDLLARSSGVERYADSFTSTTTLEGHCFQIDRSDCLLSLWEYEFTGEVFMVMDYALKEGAEVVNLWEDWAHLFNLRRKKPAFAPAGKKAGARIF